MPALKGIGVTQSSISTLVTSNPGVLCESFEKFDECLKMVFEMGFNPSTSAFIHALVAVMAMSQSTWEQKLNVFRGWGWSDKDIMLVFRKCPNCMNTSESKIMNAMDFLVNKMGWQSTDIALYPDVFLLSLEKRVIPRCLVIKVLQSKGLLKKNLSPSTCVKPVEKLFLDRFVTKYQEQVPQLFDIFQGKIDLLELGIIRYEQEPEANQL
ncbi:hypothetical protein Patl1_29119 [Pistacia atlantica]|uniref:Uncharacterized protein n=1 Tax=Pistacia atlantica TaxID=434234 RepID=A0ACC1BEX0_9ROSI|nr:hypothetical protein Patl1_29119 [Pistacia atlantica]